MNTTLVLLIFLGVIYLWLVVALAKEVIRRVARTEYLHGYAMRLAKEWGIPVNTDPNYTPEGNRK